MKSHVSLEQHQCPVCLSVFDTGSILLDKRLRESMEQHTVTGQSLCPSCVDRKEQGYIALIEADERTHKRLGRVVHLRSEAWGKVFNVPPPEGGICMVPSAVIDQLVSMVGG